MKDWNRLLSYGQAWTKAQPNSPQAWFVVGWARSELNQPSLAIPAYRRAVQLQPQWPQAWYSLGYYEYQTDQYAAAAADLQHAVEQLPSNPFYWDYLANAARKAGQIEAASQAIQGLEKNAKSASEWGMAGSDYYQLAIAAKQPAFMRRAKADFQHALQMDPQNGNSWTYLGATEQVLGNNQAALADYQKAAQLGNKIGAGHYAALYAQLHQAQQTQSDWLIVPGKRVGSVSLGVTESDAAKALGQPDKCDTQLLNGKDVSGTTSCEFKRWGMWVDFKGQPSSPIPDRRVDLIEVSRNEGPVSAKYLTGEGIKIGSSEQDLLKAYGDPTSRDNAVVVGVWLRYESIGIRFRLGGQDENFNDFPKNVISKFEVYAPGTGNFFSRPKR